MAVIMVLDDVFDAAHLTKRILTESGHRVTAFTEEDKALQFMRENAVDLAILDIMGVDGLKLLEETVAREIPTVMLTAHALSPGNVVKSYKEGAASYLPKEEMVNIASFLNDVLEAKEKGKNPWVRWYDRMGSFFEKKFGPKWQDDEKDFLETMAAEPDERLACQCKVSGDVKLEVSE